MTDDRDLTPDLEALLHDAAAGDLSDEDAERLRALADDDRSIAALAAEQRAVADALRADVAPLTDVERARLRREVLDAVAPAGPAQTAAPRWTRWAFSAAAVLVVVVGVASVLLGGGFFTGGGDDAADLSADATIAATESADDADESTDAGGDDAAFDREEADIAEAPESDEAGAGDGGADGGGESATPDRPFPACPGEVVVADGLATFDSALEAADALDTDVPTEWDLEVGDQTTDGETTTSVLTWFDGSGSVVRQVELASSTDGVWSVARSIDCTG